MNRRRVWVAAASGLTLTALAVAPASVAATPGPTGPTNCSSGAHTLSHFGDHVYPETGNGGYTSLHTDVHMVYDAPSNQFLPGNHVVLTVRATQCLTDFSLDFERRGVDANGGPDMTLGDVSVKGGPATTKFVQPTYPGDPNGQDDPDPLAHEASQVSPVGGPHKNPFPPACTPEVTGGVNAKNGDQCPSNKLVITPSSPIAAGTMFTVTVFYTGRPGVHTDGDGTTEGWFRNDTPPGDGGFVTTEPVATEDWMPLNDHPTAKPTYDFYDTVNAGRTAVANGMLLSKVGNPPSAQFPVGSTTWHWHSPAPVASYLVENSVGAFDLTWRDASDGIRYYEAQSSGIDPAQKQANLAIMDQQQDITDFQTRFNGPFPFTSDGVLVGIPESGFEEEMQTMITFQGGQIDLDTFNHENMHQWWGDNVTEANYNLTFFKEGMATFGEYLFDARNAATAAGGLDTSAGDAAFDASLITQFNTNYANKQLWTSAPSDPTPATLFSGRFTYTRPGTAYLALRQILDAANFNYALQQIQRDYRFASITEKQLEAEFHAFLPNPSAACHARLDEFFTEWFDTAYPSGGGGANRPQITGPGLTGPGFYNPDGTCG
jgi:Peptidase family M1 domain